MKGIKKFWNDNRETIIKKAKKLGAIIGITAHSFGVVAGERVGETIGIVKTTSVIEHYRPGLVKELNEEMKKEIEGGN